MIMDCALVHLPPKPPSLFRYFPSKPAVIREAELLYVQYPLSLRNVENLLFERGYCLSSPSFSLESRVRIGLSAPA